MASLKKLLAAKVKLDYLMSNIEDLSLMRELISAERDKYLPLLRELNLNASLNDIKLIISALIILEHANATSSEPILFLVSPERTFLPELILVALLKADPKLLDVKELGELFTSNFSDKAYSILNGIYNEVINFDRFTTREVSDSNQSATGISPLSRGILSILMRVPLNRQISESDMTDTRRILNALDFNSIDNWIFANFGQKRDFERQQEISDDERKSRLELYQQALKHLKNKYSDVNQANQEIHHHHSTFFRRKTTGDLHRHSFSKMIEGYFSQLESIEMRDPELHNLFEGIRVEFKLALCSGHIYLGKEKEFVDDILSGPQSIVNKYATNASLPALLI